VINYITDMMEMSSTITRIFFHRLKEGIGSGLFPHQLFLIIGLGHSEF
jgi:hypothetical protein